MTVTVLYESAGSGAFLVSEMPGTGSRDLVFWDNTGGSADLQVVAGTVYSLELTGTATATANSGNHGNGTFGTITPNQQTEQLTGPYVVNFTSATAFNVIGPDGRELQPGVVGTAYADELGFTITAGGTAFQAGDGFSITIAAGTGYATQYTGAAPAAGVLFTSSFVPAGGTLQVAAITRNAEVNLGELIFPSGMNSTLINAAIAQLAAKGIVAR